MTTPPIDRLQRCQRIRCISMKYSDMADNNYLPMDILIAYSRKSLLLSEIASAEYRIYKKLKQEYLKRTEC